MGEYGIRKMNYEDAEAVTDVLINTWQTSYRGIVSDDCLDHMDRNTLIERRRRQYKNYIVVVMEGRIVGFCWYMNNNSYSQDVPEADSEVVALYVLPECQGKSLGRALITYAMDDLREQGRKKMVIWCLKENHPSRKFYKKMGGTIFGEHKTHIGNQDYDEVGFMYSL